jgi:uncharacterized protein with ATP-grasp and redox domains
MKAYPECIPCLIRQGLNAGKKLNLPKEKLYEISKLGVKYLCQFETYDQTPAYYAYYIQKNVTELTGSPDPFKEIKKLSNQKALEIYPILDRDVYTPSEDRLLTALKLSAIGNILDFAILEEEEAFKKVEQLLERDFTVNDYERFKGELKNATKVIILGDNAGEIVFDKFLVRALNELGKEVVYVVKGGPILNDATMEDAKEVSMTELCRVIDNGNDRVGTYLREASQEFLKEWENAEIIISKGQANFESLSGIKDKVIYFLLTAKCEPIALETGAKKVGALVFKRND